MIIKCTKCETSFRFEDQLMAGEGVWVRCGHCSQVFFQDNPAYTELGSLPPETAADMGVSDREELSDLPGVGEAAPLQRAASIREETEEDEPLPFRVKEIREIMEAEAGHTALRSAIFEDLEALTVEESASDLSGESPEPVARGKANKFAAVGKFFAYFFLALSIATLLAGLSLWIFPAARQQAANFFSPSLPMLGGLAKGQKTTDPATGQVLLQDVRQHFVNNWLMGNLWVVEGAAINTGRYALTLVQVQGRLYDHSGNVLAERVSFCGNLLTDAELSTMTEEDILKRLTQPPGGGLPGNRLSPGGQVPFMIVLVHDQPAVANTTVKIAGAEKLLE